MVGSCGYIHSHTDSYVQSTKTCLRRPNWATFRDSLDSAKLVQSQPANVHSEGARPPQVSAHHHSLTDVTDEYMCTISHK